MNKNGTRLRNKGNIYQYNLLTNEFMWRKEMFFNPSKLSQDGNNMIYSTANANYCLDINTGNKLWMVNKILYHSDPINHIGLGYNQEGTSNKLKGFNLLDGDILWKRKIDCSYAWNDLLYLNDTTILVVSAGLHSINIKNGNGWDYHTITGDKDYTPTVIINVSGIVAGLFTGTFIDRYKN